MRFIQHTRRNAFSLLEMVLALAIGMVLLGALYFTLNTQVTHTQAGRDVLAEGAVARSILTRIANDIAGQVGSIDPRVIPNNNPATNGSSSSSSSTASTSSTSSASSTGTSGTSGSSGSSTASSSSSTAAAPNQVAFNVGVRGDATNLTLSTYRMQKPSPDMLSATSTQSSNATSDLRSISYWLANSSPDSKGLARKEFVQATAEDVATYPSSLPDQEKCIFAEEVSNLVFEYFDGVTWQSSWDGTQMASGDTMGVTPMGPPVAIRITITLRHNMNKAVKSDSSDAQGAQYQHIVAIPAANFFQQ